MQQGDAIMLWRQERRGLSAVIDTRLQQSQPVLQRRGGQVP